MRHDRTKVKDLSKVKDFAAKGKELLSAVRRCLGSVPTKWVVKFTYSEKATNFCEIFT